MKFAKIAVCLLLVFCTVASYAAIAPSATFTQAFAASQTLTVTGSAVNVRSDAGTEYAVVTTATKGSTYEVLGSKNDSKGVVWYKVTVNGKTGYITSEFVSVSNAANTTTTAAAAKVLTAKTAAGAYASPTKSSAKSATMIAGQQYTYTSVYTGGDKVKWYLVTVGSARGWVCQTDVILGAVTTTSTKPTTTTTTAAAAKVLTAKSAAGAYASPTKSSAKSATMVAGQQYTYTSVYTGGDKVKWYLVTVGGARGWVCQTDVTLGSVTTTSAKPTTTTTAAAAKVLTAKSAAGAYASPTKSSAKSATMVAGQQYYYTSVYTGGDKVKWYLVTVGSARGWVCQTDVTVGGTPTTTTTTTTQETTTTTTQSTTSSTETTTTTTTAAPVGSPLTAKTAAGVYASPTKSSAKSATMTAGNEYYYTSVYTGGDKVKWYLVTVGSARGWVCETDITLGKAPTTTSVTTTTTTTTTTVAPTTTTTTQQSGSVLTANSAAGVYASPTKSSEKSATMTAGNKYYYTSVYTGGDKVKWYLVTVGDARGWVCETDITLGTSTTAPTTTSAKSDKTVIAKNAAGVYASPTKSSTKVASMTAGNEYNYTSVYTGGDKVKWYLVTVGSARGWACETDVKINNTSAQAIYNRLDELRAKFPDGKYWNHYGSSKVNLDGWTDTPCPSGHYLNGVQQCNGQCDGFARKLGLDLFGLSTYSWKRTTYNINTVCVGDLIRYNSKHTIMVVGFTNDPNTIIVADCNWDYHCKIDWDRTFSTSRYFSTVNWVLHYPDNNLNRATYLNNLPS